MKKMKKNQAKFNWHQVGQQGVGIVQTMVIGAVVATSGYFLTQQHSNQIVQFKNYSAKMEEDILMEQLNYVLSDTVACRQNFQNFQLSPPANTTYPDSIDYRNYTDPNAKSNIPVYSPTAGANAQTTTRYYDVQQIELVPVAGQTYPNNPDAQFSLRVTFQTFLRNDGTNDATNTTRKVWFKEIPMRGSFDANRRITQCATAAAFSFAQSICRAIKGQLGGAPSQVCLLDRLNISDNYAAVDNCNLATVYPGDLIPARYLNSRFNLDPDRTYAAFTHRCLLEVLADLKDKYHGAVNRSVVEAFPNESFIQKTGDSFASSIITTGSATVTSGVARVGAGGRFCIGANCQSRWDSACPGGQHATGLTVNGTNSGEVTGLCSPITAICDARAASLPAMQNQLCRCSTLRLPDGCGRLGVQNIVTGTLDCGGYLSGTTCRLNGT